MNALFRVGVDAATRECAEVLPDHEEGVVFRRALTALE